MRRLFVIRNIRKSCGTVLGRRIGKLERNISSNFSRQAAVQETLLYSKALSLKNSKFYVGILSVLVIGWVLNIWTKLFILYSKVTRTTRVAKALEEPSEREEATIFESGHYISRTQVEEELLNYLFKLERSYGLVYGEQGVGKTTLIKKVIKKARKQGHTVFYIPVEEQDGPSSFIESFAVSLQGFDVIPRYDSEYLLKDFLGFGLTAPDSISDLFPSIVKASKKLLEKTGKRPIIIIDSCNNLDTKTLIKLQNFAKEQADRRETLIIFVSNNEGEAMDALFTRSASSRMKHFKVGEISREEAEQFLEINYGIRDERFISQILEVTGYSFQYLNIESRNTIESIESYVSTSIRGHLKAIDLEYWNSDQSIISIFKKILEEDKISYSEFTQLIGNKDRVQKILKGNVFSVTTHSGDISFLNVATSSYFRNQLTSIS